MGDDVAGATERRWQGRPWLARGVKALVIVAPIVAAIVCTSIVSRALPTPRTGGEVARWWFVVLVVSTTALVTVDRFARRLLPLSVLLKLSLPFPEAPPSRIRVAIKSGNPKQLKRWADEVTAAGRQDPNAVAAHELLGLVTALSVHDRRSRGHSERVRVYTDLMADQLGLSHADADRLRWASLLHDIGKLRVPGAVLNKPGAPDADEWKTIREHPVEGDHLIEPVREWLGPWSRAVGEHHERWDGTGYPSGLAGLDISLAGRIVAVTDSYEVMTATRSYKRPMSVNAAREELTRSSGTHFDPAMVRAFLEVPIGRMSWAAGPIAWLVQLPFLGQIPTWGATAVLATSVAATTPVITHEPLPLRTQPAAVVSESPAVTEPVMEPTTTTTRRPAATKPATTTTTVLPATEPAKPEKPDKAKPAAEPKPKPEPKETPAAKEPAPTTKPPKAPKQPKAEESGKEKDGKAN